MRLDMQRFAAVGALIVGVVPAEAEEATLAVAANFAEVVEVLAADFEEASDHELKIVTGSTGQLYAQITEGAPFDVFLPADQKTPEQLETDGGIVEGSRFTYAIGTVTLWSPDPNLVPEDGAAFLETGNFRALAIANPAVAPYGVAAQEIMEAIGVWDDLQDRIVMGENIGQTHALVSTGNAEAGFVALSYVLSPRNEQPGSRWDVPADLYTPIRQDAVVTARGAGNDAALAFTDFLKSEEARSIIEAYGYGLQ